jgi:glucose 1-dehydrogenase
VAEFTTAEITRVFYVNAIAPHLVARGSGRIVNVGSIAAEIGTPDNSLYSTTKGALHAMTRALAVELGPHGVRVNGVAPGTTLSPGTSGRLAANPEMAEATRLAIPARRFGEPDEVAELIAFLVSLEADYINGNGAIITIDGGRLAAWA